MAGYTRQSVADIINGAEITAPPINAEFNQLVSAFNATTGHAHDGSTGNAPKIDLTTSITGYLPADHGGVGGKNKMDATTAPAAGNDGTEGYAPGSLWENTTNGRVYICVGNSTDAAVWRELVTVFSNNKFEPVTHNTIDLGTSSTRFKDLYLQGGATIEGASTFAGTLGVSGLSTLDSVTVTNAATLNGAVTIGNSSADLVGFNGRVTTSIVPNADDGVDLGSSSNEWRNLYIDGTATIDTLTVDENASIAGTLAVTSTSTLTGDVTMSGAADVTGNATVGGTFDVTGLSTLATVDINGGNIDGTAIGSSTASSGVFTNLTASGTINFAGATVSNLGTVTTAAIGGGTINNAVIGGSTPAAITGTTITGTSFVGPVTGDITGDVTGDVTGNVTGDVTGDLTGNVTASSGTSTFNNVTVNGNLNMDATSAATITNLTAPTNDLDAATKLYVDTAVADLVDSAPDSLNTLNELAAAINDDASAYNTLNTAIGNKLPKAGGTMSGAINMGGQKITNAADPTAAQDLATKNYIDTTYIDYSSAADAANDAEKLAVNAEDVQYTLSDGSTTGYSALHYAAKAAASYDSFDDRYLGSKASDPTLDNDNNALITGALYFDSTNGVMKVYNGTEWANASSSIEGIKSNFYYTATSGQTAFSGTDDNSNTLVIDKAGLVNVYMNGVRLHEDDYTVSAAGDSVTLAAGAATGDLIYLEVFGNFAGQSGADVAITGGSITGLTNLAVGTSTTNGGLHISSSDASQLNLTRAGVGTYGLGVVSGNALIFQDGSVERMRLNSSGGLLIASTDTDPYDNTSSSGFGIALRENGSIYNARYQATPIVTNRIGNDGKIMQFRKDGTEAGSIATQNSTDIIIDATDDLFLNAGGSTGLGIFQSGGSLQNVTAYTSILPSANDTHNLGASTLRWNRLFMGMNTPQTDANLTIRTNGNALEWGHNNVSSGYYGVLGTNVNNGNPFIGFSANANSGTGNTYDTDGFLGTILRGTTGGELSIEQVTNADADNQSAIQRIGIAATEVVINEASANTDFRVESDGNTHMLFVDAGANAVGIKTNATDAALNVNSQSSSTDAVRIVGSGGNNFIHMVGNQGQTAFKMWENGAEDPAYFYMYHQGVAQHRFESKSGENIVLNDRGLNLDFRIESASNTHALFVDANENKVGVLTSSPDYTLDVSGNFRSSYSVAQAISTTVHDYANTTGHILIAHREGSNSSGVGIKINGVITLDRGTGSAYPRMGWIRIAIDDDTSVAANNWQAIEAGGYTGNVTSFRLQKVTYNNIKYWAIEVPSGTGYHANTVSFEGYVRQGDLLPNSNGNCIDGDDPLLTIDSSKYPAKFTRSTDNATTYNGAQIFNENSQDQDFRVESNNNTHALWVDAGNDKVGIGTSGTLDAKLEVYSPNNSRALRVNCGSAARYDFEGNSTSGYTMRFNMNDTAMSMGTTSTSRPLHIELGNRDMARFNYNGNIYFSTTDYEGGLASSDDGKVGHFFAAGGNHYMARYANATGAETIIINNIHSSGASIGLLQYRTRNTVEGSIVGTSSGISISNSSDYRKKENVEDATGCLDKITGLRPVTYTHRSEYDTDTTTVHTGFIAHEVNDHIPSIVNGEKDAVDEDGNAVMQSVAYADQEMIANLVGAIKEQQATIQALEARIAALEA